jgi:hypothetical protein
MAVEAIVQTTMLVGVRSKPSGGRAFLQALGIPERGAETQVVDLTLC